MDAFYSRTFEDLEHVKKFSKAKSCLKRDGSSELVDVNVIKKRLESLFFDMDKQFININVIVYRVVQGLYENITTQEIDDLIAETCAYMNIIHPSYSLLAARVAVNSLHNATKASFVETVGLLYNYIDKGKPASLVSDDVYEIVMANKVWLIYGRLLLGND